MSEEPSKTQRAMDLLRQMEGRGLSRASDLLASQGEASRTKPATPSLERFFPDAEPIGCGPLCRRVRSEAALTGEPTRQGYRCPATPWGGPPSPAQLAALTGQGEWARLDPERILYLDTETTGLSTGAGTYAFLIGLGHVAGSRFVVDQYFMEDYDAEPALVEAVDGALADAQALVTYNGAGFDLPLLTSRWSMQRRRPPLPALHLDLLSYTRRLWRLRLPGCSLSDVETHILGLRRLSDVPGAWVPRIYFDYIHGMRPERIVPVLDHHAQDIYSMAAVVSVLARALHEPEDPRFAHASDQWGLARLFEARGRRAEALGRMEAAVLAARDEALAFRLAMHLARTYKRTDRLADAVAIWEVRVAQCRPDRLDPLIELAKHAEHTLKDFAAAERYARRALEIIRMQSDLGDLMKASASNAAALTGQLDALSRRLDRLARKQSKA